MIILNLFLKLHEKIIITVIKLFRYAKLDLFFNPLLEQYYVFFWHKDVSKLKKINKVLEKFNVLKFRKMTL